VIDFRYHLVSIVAVFLALTVGIVLGSTELQPTVASGLNSANSSLREQLSATGHERDQANLQASASDSFILASEQYLLTGLLTGQRIVIISEPGAPASVIAGITTAAKDADATVTGQISLQTRFFDTNSTTLSALTTMNTQVASSDSIVLDSTAASAQQATAQVLAGEILTKSPAPGNTPQSVAAATLQAYAGNGFLTTGGHPDIQATLAVVVTPDAVPSDGSVDALDQVLGPFAQELAKAASGVVVVSSVAGNGSGSPIQAVRGSSASSQVSTVDDADTVRGQVATIQALHQLIKGATAGAYGMDGSSPAYPSISPSASSTGSTGSNSSTGSSGSTGSTPKSKR
jgi:Copper transport outer membrane protein, MctB